MRRALLLLAGLAGCSGAPLQSDWERAHLAEITPEDTVSPPRGVYLMNLTARVTVDEVKARIAARVGK